MSNEESEKKNLNIFICILISIAAVAILLGILIGLMPLIRLPGWPVALSLFYFANIAHFAKDRMWPAAIGGFIGMTMCYCPTLFGALLGGETGIGIGWIVFLILLVVLLAMMINGKVQAIDYKMALLMVLALVPPGLHVDLPFESYLPAVGSYAIAVAIFAIIFALLTSRAKKTLLKKGD